MVVFNKLRVQLRRSKSVNPLAAVKIANDAVHTKKERRTSLTVPKGHVSFGCLIPKIYF